MSAWTRSRALRSLKPAAACPRCTPPSSSNLRATPGLRSIRNNSSASASITPRAVKAYVPTQGPKAHHGPRSKITHEVADLSPALEGQKVVLSGWLFAQRRASENLHFFTLRSSTSSVQLVSRSESASKGLMEWPLESVVLVQGTVKARKQKAKKVESAVDEIELEVDSATLLNPAEAVLPFYPNRPEVANEDLRAQHRYLDLRRTELAENLKMRSKVAHIVRNYLHDNGFTEVETPVLLNSSPEGAREFLVPTRSPTPSGHPTFYALPQSPQQPKQLLISSGAIPRYYQIARCFRDEDGRKDRQPEFTQIDLEMAFVSGAPPQISQAEMRSTWAIGGSEVREIIEGLVKKIWKEVKGVELEGWFRVMPYDVAMDVYGSDKPDTRFEMYTLPIGYYPSLSDGALDKILLDQSPSHVEFMITPADHAAGLDIPTIAKNSQYVSYAFSSLPRDLLGSAHDQRATADNDSLLRIVLALAVSHFQIDYVKITEKNVYTWHDESVLTKPLGLDQDRSLPAGVKPGDVIWLSRRKKIAEGGWTHLGRLRIQLMEALVAKGLMTLSPRPHFLWITQFPLFTLADEDKSHLSKGRYASTHHPFTAPMFEDLEDLKAGKVEGVRGQHYDLVLDGQEIGGGSVRIHDAEFQEWIMKEVLQLDDQEKSRFDHLLKALKCGAPPHGGIALGFDRLIAILCGAKSIRDVIAFPKTGSGIDPVFKSPSVSGDEVLKEYGLRSLEKKQEGVGEEQQQQV
ncbi:aspartate-tRNA ligase [Kwoniella heveanensis BCC8398]|uniref:Aspartate-tRNA ligase n=1 Tax=Kwoniella heveanensis BCC8398 TaxID=1296120 RepID=A0A1B9GQ09_9TREE|nr:aspartate-tRNA ligase [Kwoniella heveanensis BCC8398]